MSESKHLLLTLGALILTQLAWAGNLTLLNRKLEMERDALQHRIEVLEADVKILYSLKSPKQSTAPGTPPGANPGD